MTRDAFSHEAMFYEDREEFLETTVPYLRGALEDGEPALVAVTRSKAELLKGELGSDAAQVSFADIEELGRNPARIFPLWRDFLDANREGPARGIGEPIWPRRSSAEIDESRRHEALLNVAFSEGPAWRLLCPYDSASLDDTVLEEALSSHPFVSHNDERRENGAVTGREPLEPHAGALSAPPAAARTFRFDRRSLADARALVAGEATRARLSADRGFDLVAAAGELLANSIMHGGGEGLLSVWEEDDALVAEVCDEGLIEEPLVGRLRPQPSQEGGRGLWLANHLCDLVQIRSGPTGTAVRLYVGHSR